MPNAESRKRPILIDGHVTTADGRAYSVFVDVNDDALRRVLPLLIANPTTPIPEAAFTVRLVEVS